MKRFLLAAGVAALAVSSVSAQIELREDDGTTDFTSRGFAGSVTGWATTRHEHIGINEIDRYFNVIQDQNCTTQEVQEFALHGTIAGNATPDETNVIATTGTFGSATSTSTGACAWLWTTTFTTPLAASNANVDFEFYSSVLLPSNANWVSDGPSAHISIHNAGGSAEFPNGQIAAQYPPSPLPGVGPGARFGAQMLLGSGGGAATTYSGTWRIYNRSTVSMSPTGGGVAYDVRHGASESPQSAGLYTSIPAVGPDNYGMAGYFPDFTNDTGTAPAREDNQVYRTDNQTFLAGIEQVFLSTGTLRQLGAGPIDTGLGRFELNPIDSLFDASPALLPTQPVTGPNLEHRFDLGVTGSAARNAFGSLPMGTSLDVNYQAVRIDLGTGAVEISSCRRWSYEG